MNGNMQVTAIFQKGDKRKPNNYRPEESITCIISKIIESIIRDKIMEHIENKNLFSNKEFGFLNGRSTAYGVGEMDKNY